jgi:hypothetical protein
MDEDPRERLARLADEAAPGEPDIGSIERRGKRRRAIRRSVAIVAGIGIGLTLVLPLRALSGLGSAKQDLGGASESPSGGYWVRFPDSLSMSVDGIQGSLELQTNLPEGTLYYISSSVLGACCPGVKDGTITLDQLQNPSCYGLVGDIGNAPDLSLTVTIAPEFNVESHGPANSSSPVKQQPMSVTDVLGKHFENLTGQQVIPNPDAPGNELVAKQAFPWPQPQCGGNPFPLFGGPDCNPADQENQLQGDTLGEAMSDVMGAISQARMCEFWSVELPPNVEAQRPWPQFASEWRDWYTNPAKDFAPKQQGGTWADSALDWSVSSKQGQASIVVITNHGDPILQLTIEPLPGFCSSCSSSVVPFWGVMDWKFLG